MSGATSCRVRSRVHSVRIDRIFALQADAKVQRQARLPVLVRGYAMYFVLEVMGTRIGRVVVDFGSKEVHIVDIAIVPEARGRGYGTQILRLMQQAAAKARAPLTLAVGRTNTRARQLYLALGFRVEQADAAVERMAWHPPA